MLVRVITMHLPQSSSPGITRVTVMYQTHTVTASCNARVGYSGGTMIQWQHT